MSRKILKFEMGMSGTGFSTHNWELDVEIHSDYDIRNLVGVLVTGLFQTKDEIEISGRYLKVIGDNGSVQWTSKKIQRTNPDIDCFNIPQPFIDDKVQIAINERNEAWCQLEENDIEIRPVTLSEE